MLRIPRYIYNHRLRGTNGIFTIICLHEKPKKTTKSREILHTWILGRYYIYHVLPSPSPSPILFVGRRFFCGKDRAWNVFESCCNVIISRHVEADFIHSNTSRYLRERAFCHKLGISPWYQCHYSLGPDCTKNMLTSYKFLVIHPGSFPGMIFFI